jgi:hypothetical protein
MIRQEEHVTALFRPEQALLRRQPRCHLSWPSLVKCDNWFWREKKSPRPFLNGNILQTQLAPAHATWWSERPASSQCHSKYPQRPTHKGSQHTKTAEAVPSNLASWKPPANTRSTQDREPKSFRCPHSIFLSRRDIDLPPRSAEELR